MGRRRRLTVKDVQDRVDTISGVHLYAQLLDENITRIEEQILIVTEFGGEEMVYNIDFDLGTSHDIRELFCTDIIEAMESGGFTCIPSTDCNKILFSWERE